MKKNYLLFCLMKQTVFTGIFFLIFSFISINIAYTQPTEDVFDKIMYNVQQIEIKEADLSSSETKTADYLAKVKEDGSFDDVNYASTAQTNWPPLAHLDRLKPMVLSYILPENSYYQDEALYNTIVNMLNYWYQANPSSTNWFNQEMGWPTRMGIILILMRLGKEQVPDDIESKILTRMKSISKGPNQAGSQGTGANKMGIAKQWIYRNCLQRNKTELDFAVDQLYLPLTFNLREGLQHDYSYLQHGQQLYIGGYGNSVLTDMTQAAFYFESTEYETSGERLALISEFVKRAYIPTIRGRYMLYNAVGRGMASKNGIDRTNFITLLHRMIELDPENETEYENSIKRINESEKADYELQPVNTHFWRGDYTVHQRKGYTIDVRMASTYTCRNENGNGENPKGYFLTDGASQIAINGDEYLGIFPVWDWARIPGITAPALTSIPQPSQWEHSGTSRFTGGASDGTYGVTTYHLQDLPGYASYNYNINTEAKKSWFFFDKEIVCLGSDIKSTHATQINTTVNQCLLSGDVQTLKKDGTTETLSKGTHNYIGELTWVQHNQVAYYFPEGGNITVRNDSQSGTWNSISTSNNDATTVNKDVFKVWFNHGIKPTDESYSYIIVPNINSMEEAQNHTVSDIEILANNEDIQAVLHKALDILGIVFHAPATFEYGDLSIRSKQACTVMYKNISSDEIQVSLADPTRKLEEITLLIVHPGLGSKQLVCTMDNSSAYGGSTHSYILDEDTPEYFHVPVENVSLDKEEIALGLGKLFGELTATVMPENASEPDIKWTSSNENVARVNEEGGIVAYGKGEAVISVTTVEGNFSSSCLVTVDDYFYSALADADAYVYDGSASTNYGTTSTVTVRTDGSGYERRAFYKFPLSDLEKMDTQTQTAKVKIALYVESGADNVTEVYWMLYPVATTAWG